MMVLFLFRLSSATAYTITTITLGCMTWPDKYNKQEGRNAAENGEEGRGREGAVVILFYFQFSYSTDNPIQVTLTFVVVLGILSC